MKGRFRDVVGFAFVRFQSGESRSKERNSEYLQVKLLGQRLPKHISLDQV